MALVHLLLSVALAPESESWPLPDTRSVRTPAEGNRAGSDAPSRNGVESGFRCRRRVGPTRAVLTRRCPLERESQRCALPVDETCPSVKQLSQTQTRLAGPNLPLLRFTRPAAPLSFPGRVFQPRASTAWTRSSMTSTSLERTTARDGRGAGKARLARQGAQVTPDRIGNCRWASSPAAKNASVRYAAFDVTDARKECNSNRR
jgi:hypothetical protein